MDRSEAIAYLKGLKAQVESRYLATFKIQALKAEHLRQVIEAIPERNYANLVQMERLLDSGSGRKSPSVRIGITLLLGDPVYTGSLDVTRPTEAQILTALK